MAGTITDRLAELFTRYGDRPAVQFEDRWWTWEAIAAVDSAVEDLRAGVGIESDAPVALVLRDRPETLAALLAVLAHRRAAVLLSPLLPDAELARAIAARPAPVVVAIARDWERPGLDAAGEASRSLAVALRTDGTPVVRGTWEVRSGAEPDGSLDGSLDGVALTVLTSGTTGPPTRVPVPYDVLDAIGGIGPAADPRTARGATINTLPLVSVGGALGVASAVWRGRPVALMERFDVAIWAALVRQHRPRHAGGPPAVLRMVLDAGIPPGDLASVTCFQTGSAPVDPDVAAQFEATYGIPVLVSYGATEFLAAVTSWTIDEWKTWHDRKRGSVGRPVAGFQVRVVDDAGRVLGADEPGRLEVKPPLKPGDRRTEWVVTNDQARIDGDGFVWVIGRLDDVVIRGGFKVQLAEVQRVLEQHPAVREAAVVGIADRRLGQVPAALVVPAGDTRVDAGALCDWARQRLAAYQVPVRIEVTGELPRNQMLKVATAEVRRLLESQSPGPASPRTRSATAEAGP